MITATPAPWPGGAMSTGMSVPSLVVTIVVSLTIMIPCHFRGRENHALVLPFYRSPQQGGLMDQRIFRAT